MAWSPKTNGYYFRAFGLEWLRFKSSYDNLMAIRDAYYANGASGDPDFVDAENIPTSEFTSGVAIVDELENWFENGVVSQGDRKTVITQILASFKPSE